MVNLTALWRAIGIKGAVIAGLLVALAILAWRADHIAGQRDRMRADLDRVELAQEAAKQRALAVKAETERTLEELRHDANDTQAALAADYRTALARYVERMRTEAVGRASGGTNPAGEDQAAGRAENAGQETGLVGVTEADLTTLVENTARLEAAKAWADGLVRAGMAE